MDDVLADFDGEFYNRWYEQHPDIEIIPYEERKCFYIKDEIHSDLKTYVSAINSGRGFIRSLPVIPNSVEAVKKIAVAGNNVFICTAPLDNYENCVLEKYEWIEEHLGREWTKKIILTKDKTLIRGDILIDDKPDITGKSVPEWEHILYDKPYNRHINHLRRINWNNWEMVLKDILNPK